MTPYDTAWHRMAPHGTGGEPDPDGVERVPNPWSRNKMLAYSTCAAERRMVCDLGDLLLDQANQINPESVAENIEDEDLNGLICIHLLFYFIYLFIWVI